MALRILPLGDSITWGYRSSDGNGYRQDLLNMLSGNPVQYVGSQHSGNMADNFNEGHPGAVISQIADYASLSLPGRPNIVLLMAGTNDCNKPEDPAGAPARLGSLIDKCIAAYPDAVIIVAQLTPIASATSQANVDNFNAAVPGVVASRLSQGAHILTVNMGAFVTVGELDDGLHPNDAGYANMATAWFGALEKAASNGWISSLESTGKGQGTCLSGLYWDPSHGSIASGVGSGDASFTSVWKGAKVVGGLDKLPKGSFQSSGFRLGRMYPNTGSSILTVSSAGAVTLFVNDPITTIPEGGGWGFTYWAAYFGLVASGIGDGPGVTFADIDGDGLDDYIWISEDGIVTAYRNGGQGPDHGQTGTWIWIPMGVIASNLGGGVRGTIIFGDIDGDGRADYHVVNNATGALTSFLNMGPGINPTWQPLGQIASGLGGGGEVMLADLNGDGRADYIWSNPATGVVTAYINTRGLASGLGPVWIPANINLTFLGAKFNQIAFADFTNDNKADYFTQTSDGIQLSASQSSGLAYVTGDGTRFADLNGDGLDDYIWMDIHGAITLYLNGGWDSSGKQIWLPQGVIATGVGSPRSEIHLADLDGDGLADYLVVDPKSGAVTLWKNGGSAANQANGWLWLPQGKIASGIGAGAGVRFADIDGDGRDDYLWLDGNGAVTAYINGGPSASQPGGWLWLPQGVIATGVGAARQDVQFADINGDGKADYLWVGRIDGTVNLWYNGGPGSDKWIWYPAGEVATGTGSNGQSVMFADTTGSGRDDYLVVTPSTGAVSVWLNGCSGGFGGGSAPFKYEWTAWGDSYASGVGSGAYIDGRRCLRYDNAYPILLRDDPDHLWTGVRLKINNVACSGAKAKQVTDYQLYQTDQSYGQPSWQYYPRPSSGKPLVGTLSVGGDDIDFPGILNNCIMEGFP